MNFLQRFKLLSHLLHKNIKMLSDPNKILFQARYQPYNRRNWTDRKMNIILTNEELELCNFLTLVTQHLKENCPELPSVELRIAGGWVRDKVFNFILSFRAFFLTVQFMLFAIN